MESLLMKHEAAILKDMGKLAPVDRAVPDKIMKKAGFKKADIDGKFRGALLNMDSRGYIRWSDAEGTHGAYVVTDKGNAALQRYLSATKSTKSKSSQPLNPGVHIMSRFGLEWELLSEVNADGYVKARRLEDGAVREIHTSDIKCIA